MTKQQDFSMWSVNFILFCLANFLYYGAFYLYIPVLPQYVEMLVHLPISGWLVALSGCRPLLYGRIWVNWPTNGVVSV